MPGERRMVHAATFALDVPKVMGKPRPRYGCGKTRQRLKGGKPYTPPAYRRYEEDLRSAMRHQFGEAWSEWPGEVRVRISISRKYPKSRPLYSEGEPDTLKPDADNVAKSLLDAANGIAWADDAQVTYLSVTKHPRWRRSMERIEMSVEYWSWEPRRKGAGS